MTDAPEQFNSVGPAPAPRGQTEDRADGVERDWLKRYILPQLDGTEGPVSKQGTKYGMTRVSTVKSAIVNKDGVRRWREIKIGTGLAKSPELNADLMRAVAADDSKAVAAVLERAFALGGGKEAADRGTAMHEVTERIKKGEPVDVNEVPEDHRRDVQAYLGLLEQYSVRPVAGMQERIVKCPYGIAGTFDDMVNWFNPDTEEWELVIADLKTGRDLTLGYLEILMQLWLYANAEAIWCPPVNRETAPHDGVTLTTETPGYYIPMPTSLRKDRALVFHTPMNGTAELLLLDLSGVQIYVEAAVMARRANSEAKYKVHSIGKIDLRDAPFMAQPTNIPPGPVYNESFPGQVTWNAEDGTRVNGQHVPPPVNSFPADRAGQEPTGAMAAAMFPGQVTPQMVADAKKADERRNAAGLSPAGMSTFASSGLDGMGKPLAPLAEKGKKGCSVCRRTGHRKGGPACLGLNDPSFDNPNALLNGPPDDDDNEQNLSSDYLKGGIGVTLPTIEQKSAFAASREQAAADFGNGGTVHPDDIGPGGPVAPASSRGPATVGVDGPSFHNDADHQAPGWTPGGVPEQWVCSACGLPSELAEQQRLFRLNVQSYYVDPNDPANPVKPEPGPLDLIAQAQTSADVIAVVQTLQAKGWWSAEIDAVAQARYHEVQFAGWPK